MALKIDINRKVLEGAIDLAIASCRRGVNTSKRPEFAEVYNKEIEELFKGKASITEVTK